MLTLLVLDLLVAASFAGPACLNGAKLLQRGKLSCGNKQYIVDYHNKIRNYVASGAIESQPKAANMIELIWSESLAQLSQKRADTCIFEHGDTELNGENVGQNLAMVITSSSRPKLNITSMINLWYNEVFEHGYTQGFEPNAGHYSQLIWGTTREVGCGYSIFKEGEWYNIYFVCDYFPPGNYIGQKPYVYGKRNCKRYGMQDSVRYSKLCAPEGKVSNICKVERMRLDSDILNNSTSAEETAVEINGTISDSNDTYVDSGETFNKPNGDDEFVTANYGEFDESAGLSSDESAVANTTTPVCNDNSSSECLQHVGQDEATNNASVEGSEPHCSQMASVYNKTEEDIRRIYWNLEILKNIFTQRDKSPERLVGTDSSAGNETMEESTESEIVNDDPGNHTLHMVEESLQLAEKILETFNNHK